MKEDIIQKTNLKSFKAFDLDFLIFDKYLGLFYHYVIPKVIVKVGVSWRTKKIKIIAVD